MINNVCFLVLSNVEPYKNFTRSRYSQWLSTTEMSTADNDIQSRNASIRTLKQNLLNNGDANENPNEKHVCGEKTGENHPWIVVLEHTDPRGRSRKKTVSKGVLIDNRHVLTTVSSIHNSHPFWTV